LALSQDRLSFPAHGYERNGKLRLGITALIPGLVALSAVAVDAADVAGPTPDGTPLAGWTAMAVLNDPYADPPKVQLAEADVSQETRPMAPPASPIVVPPPPVQQVLPPQQPLPPVESTPPAVSGPMETAEASETTPESLRAAIVQALKENPDIQIALARQDDARYGVHEAWSGYLPHLDMTVAMGSEYNGPQTGSTTTLRRSEGVVTLNQNIWDFGTTANDIARARASYRSAQWSTRERIEAIAYDISQAYLNVLERQKLVDLASQEIAATEKILKMVSIQEDLGLTTPADVSRAKARLENVQAKLLDRKSALQQSREAYRRLTRHLPGMTLDLPATDKALPASAAAAVAMIDDHNPRMAQAVQDRRSLEKQRASQTGTFFPRVSLVAQGNWKDDVQGRTGTNKDARAMVTVSYSFFNGGRDIATRNRISARLREADYEVDRRRREVEQDIRIDFNALEAARQKISAIDSEIASAEKVADLYRQQFREGRRSVFDLLDSQQILFDAKARQLTNNTDKTLAEFRVLQQLGGLFDLVSEGQPLPKIVTPAPGSQND
jgi:TolC family type I secretion outer membrane protein